jgi:hypothetical protein
MPQNSPRRISEIKFPREYKREGMKVRVEMLGKVEKKKTE